MNSMVSIARDAPENQGLVTILGFVNETGDTDINNANARTGAVQLEMNRWCMPGAKFNHDPLIVTGELDLTSIGLLKQALREHSMVGFRGELYCDSDRRYNSAILRELLPQPAGDEKRTITHPEAGIFQLEPDTGSFVRTCWYRNQSVRILLDIEAPQYREHCLQTAADLMARLATCDNRVREYLARHLPGCRSESDNYIKSVDSHQGELKRKLHLQSVCVYSDDRLEFSYECGQCPSVEPIIVGSTLRGLQ